MEGSTDRRAVKIRVRAYAGYRGEETPREMTVAEATVGVAVILDRWTGQDRPGGSMKRFFKVRGNDGLVRTIFFDEQEGAWFLSP